MKTKTLPFLIVLIISLGSCQNPVTLTEGLWRAVLTPDTTRSEYTLPFNIDFQKDESGNWQATILNAAERINISEIEEFEDSLTINLPVFEGYIKTTKKEHGFVGTYTHKAAGRSWSAPLVLTPGTMRFDVPDEKPLFDPSGRWEVTVNPDSENPEIQIGEFSMTGTKLTGTFLTVVGDYRFLDGTVSGNKFMLSCFDGAHSLLFTARLGVGGTLEDGVFVGGPSWNGSWTAKRNNDAALPDATKLTFIKPGYDGIEFEFPDIEGNMISMADQKFSGKPKIIQIIGSWCPNCMDETRFFAELYDIYNPQGLEIIALCFESDNKESSINAINRFKSGIGADYTFLYAGVSNKRLAAQSLPMLNRIISYPTSIFIDKENNIRKIFTGFTGPGTGSHFISLSDKMITLIEEML